MAAPVGVASNHSPMIKRGMMLGVASRISPAQTVVLGAALIIAAMVGATFVWLSALPGWSKAILLVLALLLALTGWVMTFRDLSPPRRRR